MTIECAVGPHIGEARGGSANFPPACRVHPPHIICDMHVVYDKKGKATCPACDAADAEKRQG